MSILEYIVYNCTWICIEMYRSYIVHNDYRYIITCNEVELISKQLVRSLLEMFEVIKIKFVCWASNRRLDYSFTTVSWPLTKHQY